MYQSNCESRLRVWSPPRGRRGFQTPPRPTRSARLRSIIAARLPTAPATVCHTASPCHSVSLCSPPLPQISCTARRHPPTSSHLLPPDPPRPPISTARACTTAPIWSLRTRPCGPGSASTRVDLRHDTFLDDTSIRLSRENADIRRLSTARS